MSNIEIVRMWNTEDNHDKLYGAYYNSDTREYLGVWGRRGKNLSSQVKKNTSYSEFLRLVNSKKSKGYEIMFDSIREEVENRLTLDEVANRFMVLEAC